MNLLMNKGLSFTAGFCLFYWLRVFQHLNLNGIRHKFSFSRLAFSGNLVICSEINGLSAV